EILGDHFHGFAALTHETNGLGTKLRWVWYNGPTKLDTKTARFKLHLRAWDGFGSSTHQVSRQRLFWNCSKKRVAYRSCRRSMGSILRNFTGGARRRWKSCRRFSPENPVGKKRRPVTMNASTSSTPKLEGSAPS